MFEIIEELKVLKNKIDETSQEENPFAKTIFAVVRGLSPSRLFEMTDEEFIEHIHKIQIEES